MALAPKTVLTYPLDGANRDFTIPFEYLARKFVQVTLIGQDRKLLTLNIDYRFTLRTIITLTKNWGPADGYERIEIRRYTSATERLVDFSDGSILRAYDLNTSQVQALHIAEEGRDVASDTIGVNNDGDLDARGRKIVNLADAVSDGDAVTLRQEKEWGASALNQANRAAASNNSAIASANKAEQEQLKSYNWAQESYKHSQSSLGHSDTSKGHAGSSYSYAISSQQAQNASRNSANESAASAASASASNASAIAQGNRAETQANRAEAEANKLGNANQFMATIERVANNYVTWKDGWWLDTQRIATNAIYPRVAGPLNVHTDIIADNQTIRATNIRAVRELTVAGYPVWASNTFNPDSKATIQGVGTDQSPMFRTKSASVYGGAITLEPVTINSSNPLDAPAITFLWQNRYGKKLFSDINGNLCFGQPEGTVHVIAGKARSGGTAKAGWRLDEFGWLEIWGDSAPQGPIPSGLERFDAICPVKFIGELPNITFAGHNVYRHNAGEANTTISERTLEGFKLHSGSADARTHHNWRAIGKAF